jgi:CheY-like chemotaxis protein
MMEHEIAENAADIGTVLLIEDDEIVSEVNRSMMERLGYQVLSAKTGQEAIDIATGHSGQIDLALMDMDMPDMKGHEILPHLVSARPGLKVVICSGQLLDSGAEELMTRGAHDFLQKPFTLRVLQAMLVRHLERRHDPRTKMGGSMAGSRLKVIDISKGGFAFACDESVSDEDALIDVAVLLAEKGLDLEELECRIVPDKNVNLAVSEIGDNQKRKSVSFGKMTRKQLEALNELIKAFAGKP